MIIDWRIRKEARISCTAAAGGIEAGMMIAVERRQRTRASPRAVITIGTAGGTLLDLFDELQELLQR